MSCEHNKNIKCPCTSSCPRHGKCCECVAHHRANGFPACFFSEQGEKTYNRSFESLLKDRGRL